MTYKLNLHEKEYYMKSRGQNPNLLTSRLLLITFILVVGGFIQSAFAQSKCDCWVNSKTGQAVPGLPYGAEHNDLDPDHAYVPATGNNYHQDKDCRWINSKTGQVVPSLPYGAEHNDLDPDHAYVPATGNNYHRVVPCPPPAETGTTPQPKGTRPEPKGTTPIPKPTRSPAPTGVGQVNGRTELFIGYAYMRAPDESAKNLNGFNASLFYDLTGHVAVGGEVSAAFGSARIGTTIDTTLHRISFLAGPQVRFPAVCSFEHVSDACNKRGVTISPFARALLGAVHDTSKTTIGTTSVSSSATAFAMDFGGGVDVNLNNRIAIRPIQFDYVPTHFGGAWQSNYRISTGLVIRFGGH